MRIRTLLILAIYGTYMTVPHGLHIQLSEDGYPWWAVFIIADCIFVLPALVLACWMIDKRGERR
jgi:hypothetical protein